MASAAGSFARLLLVFEAKCQAGKIWIQGVVLGDFLKRNPRGGGDYTTGKAETIGCWGGKTGGDETKLGARGLKVDEGGTKTGDSRIIRTGRKKRSRVGEGAGEKMKEEGEKFGYGNEA